MRILAATTLALFASTASMATLNILASNSAFDIAADLEIGEEDIRNPLNVEVIDLFEENPVTRSFVATAATTHGVLRATAQGTHTLSQSADSFTIQYEGESRITADWDLDQAEFVFGLASAGERHLTRFATTEAAQLDISATLSFGLGADLANPDIPRTRIRIRRNTDAGVETLYALDSFNGVVQETFFLDPGEYSVSLFTYSSGSYSDEFDQGVFSTTDFGSISSTISVTTIPTPTAALLAPIAMTFTTRRRR